jgi:hypothetical protein
MITNPLKRQILSDERFSLDRYAQSVGFPNAQAMEQVLHAASELKATGRISDKAMHEVLSHYDPSMAATVRETVRRVNALSEQHGRFNAVDGLIAAVAGDSNIEAGKNLLEKFETTTLASGIEAKRQANDASVDAYAGRKAETAKATDPNSIRANLLRQMSPRLPEGVLPTDVLATAAERAIDKAETIAAVPEAFSRRDHIESAFDTLATGSELDSIADASPLTAGLEPQQP